MNRLARWRTGTFIVLVVLLMGIFSLRLYKLMTAEQAVTAGADSMTYRTVVEGSRGNILDRNGTVLSSNRASYNITIINYVLFNSDEPNEKLLALLDLCDRLGIDYKSHFPVLPTRPYEFDMDALSTSWQDYFRLFLTNRDYDLDIGAQTLMKNLKAEYEIPDDWTADQVYRVISVRYELELRSIKGVGMDNYTLVSDVSAEDLAAIMELGVPGVIVETGTVREYHTPYAAHLLGSIGQMDQEQYAYYKEKGYAMNALVGQSGVEYAFEDYLHGTSGMKYTTVTAEGEVLEEYFSSLPQPGNNVELSIDISLQAVAENALENVILDLRENGVGLKKGGKDAEGGAVVVQKVKTGEVLVSASYPTYNLMTFNEDFEELNQDPYAPMFNRALMAEYWPGSIYKMVTATAAIDLGGYSQFYKIEDKGIYDYYEEYGYSPRCYVWTSSQATHGEIDMQVALQESCNYYFYEIGRLAYNAYYAETGKNPMDVVAKAFGLGEPTGGELTERTGSRANKETKAELYAGSDAGWYGADVIQSAIGQSDNKFTPLQMAVYTSTIANKGTRYRATFLNRVVSWDYQQLIQEHVPEIVSQFPMSDELVECLFTGMKLCARYGTAKDYLATYPMDVACKTGTVQYGSVIGSSTDHASFVMFAPADDPEIAISVYIEKGAQGGNLANVCLPILDAYFAASSKYELAAAENTVQ